MKTILAISFSMLLLACQGEGATPAASTISPAAVAVDAATPATKDNETQGGSTAMDIDSLVPDKYVKVAVEEGDLNGDGVADALLLVEASDNASLISGEGAKRSLLIVVGDASGKFRVVRRNDNIVPCKTCGGVSGDPFGYMKINGAEGFKLVVEGGSREGWSYEYDFVYSASVSDWLIQKVTMDVVDSVDEKSVSKVLESSQFADSRFESIAPDTFEALVLE